MACRVGDRRGPQSLYKGHYSIVFYDKTGEEYIRSFDNVREILAYKGVEITRTSINQCNVELCRSLKTDNHLTKMLDGTLMSVWIVDENEETCDDITSVGPARI